MNVGSQTASSLRVMYWVAGAFSLLLSLWLAAHVDIINPDAVCYVLSAQQVGEQGISNAMHLCGQASWPFYSALIYAFSKLTSTSLVTSAMTLNALLTLVTVLAFMTIVASLGASRRVMWLAAFVILTAHQFNSVRDYIIRDHGFWAFYLLSLLSLLRFMQGKQLIYALAFGTSLAVATLFRIEGAVFLLLLPMISFFQNSSFSACIKDYMKLNTVGLSAVAMLAIALAIHPALFEKLGRAPELLNQALHGLAQANDIFNVSVRELKTHVLPSEAARDAGMIWFLVLLVSFISNLISNLSFIAAALFIYALYSGVTTHFSRAAKLVLGSYIILNLLIDTVFYAERLFLSKRYLIAFTLLLLLYVPFALDKLMSAANSTKRRMGYLAMFLLLGASMGVFLNLGASKLFIRDAGRFVTATIPDSARLYVNDLQLDYYAKHNGYQIFENMRAQHAANNKINWQAYDYYALRLNHATEAEMLTELQQQKLQFMHAFVNNRGDKVVIYKAGGVS